ncbi:hypothetical protein D3C71_771500 [compost metagenome]
MGDIKPAERHDPRDRHPAHRHRRQLAIELARKIAADFLDRLFDDVVIVEQPFRRRRYRRAIFRVDRRCAVDPQNFLLVLTVALEEVELHEAGKGIGTVARKRGTGIMQFLDRHIGRADRIVMIDLLRLGITGGGGRGNMK